MIIEPFAGSARYALEYFDREILLVDKYDVIIKIWKWLQIAAPSDVMAIPNFKTGDNINNYKFDCEEQRMLAGFLIGFGFYSPRQTAKPRLRNRPGALIYTRNLIANSLFKIRHWKIQLGSYEDIENYNATWFIDPPYQFGGHCYKESNKKINFQALGEWCQTRNGQTIVCENSKANWLPFKPMITQRVLKGNCNEVIYSNEVTAFDNIQLKLL